VRERSGRRAAIRDVAPDLVFLDVQMPELDGFAVLREVGVERSARHRIRDRLRPVRASRFDVHAIDYLLKPFTDERFQTVAGAREAAGAPRPSGGAVPEAGGPPGPRRAVAGGSRAVPRPTARQVGGKVTLLPVGEIEWIDAEGDYVRIHVGKDLHLLRETMKNLEDQLDATRFVRIHGRPS